MRAVFNVGKLLVVLLIAWLVVLVFLTGPLLRNNESEEALAKKLLETQGEVSALKKERDLLRKSLRDSTGDVRENIDDKVEVENEVHQKNMKTTEGEPSETPKSYGFSLDQNLKVYLKIS